MALTVRASGTGTTGNSTGTAISVTKPAGATTGDIVEVVITNNNPVTCSDNNGADPFTKIEDRVEGSLLRTTVWRRILDGTEAASFAWTLSSNNAYGLVLATYVGVDTTTPEDVVPVYTFDGTLGDASIITTGLTTVTAGAWSMVAVSTDGIGTVSSGPTGNGYTQRVVNTTGRTCVIYDKEIPAASTATGTQTVVISAADEFMGFQWAIRPAVTSQTVTLTAIAATTTVHSPTITTGAVTVVPVVIASTATVHSPTVTSSVTVAPSVIASTATVHSPTVSTGAVTVAPIAIASTATVHSPTVTQSEAGVQTVVPVAIASTATVHSPTVTTGAVTVALSALASTAAVHSPAVTTGAVTVVPVAIASTATVHSPTVTPGAVTLSLAAIASTATVHSPSVLPGSVTVTLETIASTAVVHSPIVGDVDVLIGTSGSWSTAARSGTLATVTRAGSFERATTEGAWS